MVIFFKYFNISIINLKTQNITDLTDQLSELVQVALPIRS